jgi:hypothetical protein
VLRDRNIKNLPLLSAAKILQIPDIKCPPPPHHAPNSTSDNDVILADFQPQKFLPHFFFCPEKNPGKPGKIDNEEKKWQRKCSVYRTENMFDSSDPLSCRYISKEKREQEL